MAKRKYTDQISFLAQPGTLETLEAIGYYRGKGGRKGLAAREMFTLGIQSFLGSLSASERGRYNEILASVRLARRLTNEADNPSPRKSVPSTSLDSV